MSSILTGSTISTHSQSGGLASMEILIQPICAALPPAALARSLRGTGWVR
ncbi:MAG TPA: hypothetical protein VL336_07205 [Sphingomicrobium sp.]|nr:hypothetical protein [Sphingomicrobium sp.]